MDAQPETARDTMVGQLQRYFDADVLPGLIASGSHIGEYALVRNFEIAGFYPTSSAAYDDAIGRWGLDEPFCLARVEPLTRTPDNVTWDFNAF